MAAPPCWRASNRSSFPMDWGISRYGSHYWESRCGAGNPPREIDAISEFRRFDWMAPEESTPQERSIDCIRATHNRQRLVLPVGTTDARNVTTQNLRRFHRPTLRNMPTSVWRTCGGLE